jgi:hypothetical protein
MKPELRRAAESGMLLGFSLAFLIAVVIAIIVGA